METENAMLPFFSFVKVDDIEVLEKVLSLSHCYVVRGGEVPKVEQWLMHNCGKCHAVVRYTSTCKLHMQLVDF